MIISLGGMPGSGKTRLSQDLAKELNWTYYDMGGVRRKMALDKGLTLAELNKQGETDPESDLIVDKYQKELGKTNDNFVITSRLSWHFIPQSFKVFLDVEENEAAKRIMNDPAHHASGEDFFSLEEAKDFLKKRCESDNLRYQKYFKVDVYDRKNYDLVVDTTNLTPEETFNVVMKAVKEKRP